MAKTTLKVRLDDELARELEDFCANVGMSVSTLINVFARRVVKDQKIPFEIKGDIPNAETLEAMAEVARMTADLSLGKTYTDVDTMMDDILKGA